MELFVRKNYNQNQISASEHISIKNCMSYDQNKTFGLFKFQSGYRKLYLNSPKGYSRKLINAQIDENILPDELPVLPQSWNTSGAVSAHLPEVT